MNNNSSTDSSPAWDLSDLYAGIDDPQIFNDLDYALNKSIEFNSRYLGKIRELDALGLVSIRVMDGVGCEKFAEHAFKAAQHIINKKYGSRCWVQSVECKEHGANGAIYANSEGR